MDRRGFDEIPCFLTRLRCHRKAVLTGVLAVLVLGACLIVGLVVGIVKLWPSALNLAQKELGLTGAVQELVTRLGYDRLAAIGRGALDSVALAALAGQSEFRELQKWMVAAPGLRDAVLSGAYLNALQEAARQKVPSIAEIDLSRVATAEVRDTVANVQQILSNAPQIVAAAGATNPTLVEVLRSEAFVQLRRDPNFSRLMSPGTAVAIDE
jgi:hypothetical protein